MPAGAALVLAGAAGAVVSFAGVVRYHDGGFSISSDREALASDALGERACVGAPLSAK